MEQRPLRAEELATILAALRYYQEKGMGEPAYRSDDIHEIATNGGDLISFNADDIDQLCEKLNTETLMWVSTDSPAKVTRAVGQALEVIHPFGYRSTDNEP